MTDDPIIHAPISKIVEAIRKKDLEVCVETFGEVNGDNINHFTLSEEDLIEALTSLGGEPKCKDCNDSGQVPIGEEQGQILYSDCPCQSPHPSLREELEDYHNWLNENPNVGFMSDMKPFDRYLAEKQSKTEKK